MKNEINHFVKILRDMSVAISFTFAFLFFIPAASAQAVKPSIDFNHNKTGFPLTGAHVRVECETCHTGGLFKGTPKDCAGCHSVGRRVVAPVKSVNHMLTIASCETCHTNTVTFLGARFNHIGVLPKACVSCHNGRTAPGKPAVHPITTASCDSCHRTTAWQPAGFDHAPPLPPCETCHTPGGPARAKPANHVAVPVGVTCDTCHVSGFTTFLGAKFDHLAANVLPNTCQTCHITGQSGAKTKPSNHLPTASIGCDACHLANGYTTFAGSTMNHLDPGVVAMACITCHNGAYISQSAGLGGPQAKPATNHPNTANTNCNSAGCHTGFTTFKGAAFDHLAQPTPVTNRCNDCHLTGQLGALMKPSGHIVTTLQCDNSGCHTNTINYTTFAGAAYDHTGTVPGTCGTCHLGQSKTAKQKSVLHIPTTGNACDACHSTTPTGNGPTNGFVTYTPTTGQIHSASVPIVACSTCHNGSYTTVTTKGALAKINGHVSTTAECNVCHTNTAGYTTFTGGKVNHAAITTLGICGTCHKTGGGATPKPTGNAHIPVTGDACDACHTYSAGTFAVNTMNHANVTTTACKTCHSATYQPIGVVSLPTGNAHIPYPTTTDCGTCHLNKIAFTNSTMNHGVVAGTTCVTCHAPLYQPIGVKGLSSGHIPTTNINCSGCHASTSSFANPATNHSVVTGIACATCHIATYASQGKQLGGAKPKPSNHITTSLTCNTCHVGTASWLNPPEVMQHVSNGNISSCKTCHDTTLAKTLALPSSIQQRTLGSHEGSKATQDCISCHATQYTQWNKP